MIILITGPKHSGKTLTSRALQKIIDGEVMDLDEVVERQTGKSPRTLYKEGPEIFKRAEAQALASLIQPKGTEETSEPMVPEESKVRRNQRFLIIAAGGGLADNPEALALLSSRREIIVVYLDVSAETAWQRIVHTAAGGELPPFLYTENPRVKPEETHLALHNRRGEAYKALADFTISGETKSPEEIAGEIANRLALYD